MALLTFGTAVQITVPTRIHPVLSVALVTSGRVGDAQPKRQKHPASKAQLPQTVSRCCFMVNGVLSWANNSDGKHFGRFPSTFVGDSRVGEGRCRQLHHVVLAAKHGRGQ